MQTDTFLFNITKGDVTQHNSVFHSSITLKIRIVDGEDSSE